MKMHNKDEESIIPDDEQGSRDWKIRKEDEKAWVLSDWEKERSLSIERDWRELRQKLWWHLI